MHARTVNGCSVAPWVTVLLAVAASQVSCGSASPDPHGIGACGTYTPTPGTALITTVETAPADALNCTNDPVLVLFDFTPSDPSTGKAATNIHFTCTSEYNEPRTWVEGAGLTVGSVHPAIREDETSPGGCGPVLIKLTDVDYSAGIKACF